MTLRLQIYTLSRPNTRCHGESQHQPVFDVTLRKRFQSCTAQAFDSFNFGVSSFQRICHVQLRKRFQCHILSCLAFSENAAKTRHGVVLREKLEKGKQSLRCGLEHGCALMVLYQESYPQQGIVIHYANQIDHKCRALVQNTGKALRALFCRLYMPFKKASCRDC